MTAFVLTVVLVVAPRAAELTARGDSAFLALNYPSAVELYQEALRIDADSAGVLWRLARVLICMGDVEEGDRSEQLYREAKTVAERAVQLDSLSADAHTWYAAALGSVALHVGGKTKVKLTHNILHELNRAIALDPHNDIAYSILGSFYRVLGSLSWLERRLAALFLGNVPEGSYEDGERALKKAIELHPTAPRHAYELGLLYIEWGKPELARGLLLRCTTLPPITLRDIRNRADAERKLREMGES